MKQLLKHRRLLAGTACLTGVIAFTGQALANSYFTGQGIAGWDYSRMVTTAQQDLRRVVNSSIDKYISPELAPVFRQSVNDAIGTLGIASPQQTAENIEDELVNLPQGDITQAAPSAAQITRRANHLLIDQQIEAVLGQEGQSIAQQKLDTAAVSVNQTRQLASTAQVAVSTQDAIKAMAQQQANTSDLLGSMHLELLQSRQDTATQSLALNDIAETLDQETLMRQAERRSEAIAGFEQAAAARLF